MRDETDKGKANTKVYGGGDCCGSGTRVGGKIAKIIWERLDNSKEKSSLAV